MRASGIARTIGVLLVGLTVTGPSSTAAPQQKPGSDFVASEEQWRKDRQDRLRSEDGWLTLAGLFWLHPGANTFGSSAECDIVLEKPGVPARAGSFVLRDREVRIEPAPGSGLMLAGAPLTARALTTDDSDTPDVVRLGELRLVVIHRGERYGIRVKDPASPARTGFRGLAYFPISRSWRIEGELVPFATPRTVQVPTVLGTTEAMESPGVVRFRAGGRRLELTPVVEEPGGDLFFIFRDRTSGRETYPAGRFLYADPPANGRVVLDFNRAYNPPCAFTPYATCPLPPPGNALEIRVEAGEKKYEGGGGGH